MAVTPEIRAEILVDYKRTRSPFKTATALGVDVADVWAVLDTQPSNSTFAERHGGEGRPELASFVVAKRHISTREWDNKDPAMIEARRLYEAGTHEMATGRDGSWLLLYSIPRRRAAPPRPNYFTQEKA